MQMGLGTQPSRPVRRSLTSWLDGELRLYAILLDSALSGRDPISISSDDSVEEGAAKCVFSFIVRSDEEIVSLPVPVD